ncbi:MAG TPA: hypothetical protein VFW89_05395 [Gemmatimonadaceae bacterium]|nr:hypothetical protein [Gemmatimonadaceae bacterium]
MEHTSMIPSPGRRRLALPDRDSAAIAFTHVDVAIGADAELASASGIRCAVQLIIDPEESGTASPRFCVRIETQEPRRGTRTQYLDVGLRGEELLMLRAALDGAIARGQQLGVIPTAAPCETAAVLQHRTRPTTAA